MLRIPRRSHAKKRLRNVNKSLLCEEWMCAGVYPESITTKKKQTCLRIVRNHLDFNRTVSFVHDGCPQGQRAWRKGGLLRQPTMSGSPRDCDEYALSLESHLVRLQSSLHPLEFPHLLCVPSQCNSKHVDILCVRHQRQACFVSW